MEDDLFLIIYTKANKRWQFTLNQYIDWSRENINDIHRTDGPAIETSIGDREWWINGNRHRDCGPAVERTNGDREWFQNGILHRTDGPAIDRSQSGFGYQWWINGRRLNEQQVNDWIKENNIVLSTQSGQTAFILRWS